MKKQLKQVIAKLKECEELLDELECNRGEVFNDRSEDWQESEAGERFSDMTDEIADFNGDIMAIRAQIEDSEVFNK